MRYLMFISFLFSIFMSIEASLVNNIQFHLVDENLIHIEKSIDTLNLFINAFNDKQNSLVLSSIASDQTELRNFVVHMMQTRNIKYLFHLYSIENGGIEILPDQSVKFMGNYELKEVNNYGKSSVQGFSNYYILKENNEGSWVIVDTDFHMKLDWGNYFFIILFLLLLFHIWMLIDCFNRKFKKRGKWFCIIIFLPFVGSLLYFFCIKLKQWDNQPNYYEQYLQNDFYSKEATLTIRSNWIYLWSFSLLAMVASIGMSDPICNSMILDIIASIKNLLFYLPIMYIFSFISAYLNLGTVAISFSLWGLLFMILYRIWECITNILNTWSCSQLLYQNVMNHAAVLFIIFWLLCLFIVSYRLLRLNEAIQDKKDLQC